MNFKVLKRPSRLGPSTYTLPKWLKGGIPQAAHGAPVPSGDAMRNWSDWAMAAPTRYLGHCAWIAPASVTTANPENASQAAIYIHSIRDIIGNRHSAVMNHGARIARIPNEI
jgi:hypothetical protein